MVSEKLLDSLLIASYPQAVKEIELLAIVYGEEYRAELVDALLKRIKK